MSNQYNNAGRSLIVDEVIEIKGTRKDSVSTFKQQLDAQLLKRDTESVQAQVSLIGSDNHVSVPEKIILSREYGNLSSAHGLIVAKAEELGIVEQTGYQEYLVAFQNLSSYLDNLLVDMGSGSDIQSHQQLTGLFEKVFQTSSILEEQFFRYTTGMLGGLDYRVKFEVIVKSSLGITVPADNTPTNLSIMLLREGEDVTDDYDDSAFTWERVSEDRVADSDWRDGIAVTGKVLSVSFADLVCGSASFLCRFKYQYSDTMYYSKSGFCTLSEEVPGPAGEKGEAYVVVIESSNGDKFKPGESMVTVLRPKVFLNGEEITPTVPDSWFRWRRKSFYEPNNDLQWNSNHVAGYRTIEVTANDINARATFFCDIVRQE